MSALTVGVDFGTESARALLVDAETGRELGSFVAHYPSGVIVESLPGGRRLGPDWALQAPGEWLDALERSVGGVLDTAGVPHEDVRGIGVAFTSCTVLPTTETGSPLCALPDWADEPHAWPKLWKHHAAQPQAEELTALAEERDEPWLARYGRVSSEWMLPKAMQALDESPSAFAAGERLVEGGDWLVWQLCGELRRNACAAGFKALWNKRDGYPSDAFLAALRPGLAGFFSQQGAGRVVPPGDPAGLLGDEWAGRLGLSSPVSVAVAIVDAHAGLIGAGITGAGTLYMATGTSTCHLTLTRDERIVPGISGTVEDGILAGHVAYEAGQASAGDMLEWYSRTSGRPQAELTDAATRLRPGESGLLALDWWNGCRTPLVDADLAGALLGATLATSPGAVYRSLLEATALGTRLVVDTFSAAGVTVDRVVAGGGLVANELMAQIYADVSGLPVEIVGSKQPSARGAAILAAAAAGLHDSVESATAAAAVAPARVVEPDARARDSYDELYGIYCGLVSALGAAGSPLKRLSALRRRVVTPRSDTLSSLPVHP